MINRNLYLYFFGSFIARINVDSVPGTGVPVDYASIVYLKRLKNFNIRENNIFLLIPPDNNLLPDF